MAHSLDPDFHSPHRSESPAGSILRRLFGFWEHEDDLAPEVAPGLDTPSQRKTTAGSQAFTIWTSKAAPRPSVITRSSTGRLCVSEFKGFTLWANPPGPLQCAASDAGEPLQLLSRAFTLWSLPDVCETLAARWEKPSPLGLPRSRAFSVWTTPAALADMGERWAASPDEITLPQSQAFSIWTIATGLALLGERSDRTERSGITVPIVLKDPRPFSTWTSPEALRAIAARWDSEPDAAPVRQLIDPHPFTIWTEGSRADTDRGSRLICLQDPQAHSIWTTVEGLASAATRWIPQHATAKVAPIPANFSDTREQPVAESVESKIPPFPGTDPGADAKAEPIFANQNNMEDHITNKIQLTESKAFTLWSTPDHWKTNPIAATSAAAPAPAHEPPAEAAVAAFVDSPRETPAVEPSPAMEPATSANASADTWKWAFILTLIGALGIIASQSAAIRSVKDDIEREVASREFVSKKLAFESGNNASLTDQLVAKSALAETLANEKVDLEAAMEAETSTLSKTIAELKQQIATKGEQISGMESAITNAKKESETAAQKILALAEGMELKNQSLTEVNAALAAAKSQSAKLGAQAKELEARLKGSASDQAAMTLELSASAEALSAAMQRATALEQQLDELKAKLAESEDAAPGQ